MKMIALLAMLCIVVGLGIKGANTTTKTATMEQSRVATDFTPKMRPINTDAGVALGQSYVLNCSNWHEALSPRVVDMMNAWHRNRPEQVFPFYDEQRNFIKQMVATGRAPNEKIAWAMWCTGIKPAMRDVTRKLDPGYWTSADQ